MNCWNVVLVTFGLLLGTPAFSQNDSSAKAETLIRELSEKHSYRLDDNQIAKRIAPPFVEARKDYFHADSPESNVEEPGAILFRWDGQKLKNTGMTLDDIKWGFSFGLLIQYLTRLNELEIEADQELLLKWVPGDWVIREQAPVSELLVEVETILRDECRLPVNLRYEDVEREVWVAYGEFRFQPLPGQSSETIVAVKDSDKKIKLHPVQAFASVLDSEPPDQCPIGRGVNYPLQRLLREQVIDGELDRPNQWIDWRQHKDATTDTELVMKNITKQTGVTFRRERKIVKRLIVTPSN